MIEQPLDVALVGAEFEENLSLRYLAAAVVQAGLRVQITPFDNEDQIQQVAQTLAASRPRLVGLSLAFQHRAREFVRLARALRAAGYQGHICCGGHVPTASWRELLRDCPEVDTVVRHDGEQTLPELLSLLDQPQRWPEVAGLSYRDAAGEPTAAPDRRQLDQLDPLPFPLRDRPHVHHVGLGFAPVLGSRGCYCDCAFCCINSYHRGSSGRRLRFRTPANLAREMASLYHQRGARIFCFHDDTFFLPRPRDSIRRLVQLRQELDALDVGQLGMVGKCRPDQLDRELLTEARRCGVFRLYLGLENGSEAGLLHLGRKHDLQDNLRGLALMRQTGMFACFNILLFEPETRFADLEQNLAFLRGATDFPFNFCRAEVYSGSRLEQRLRQQGRLLGGWLGHGYEIHDPRVELAFRLSAICFSSRNFAADGVANTNTGLGYEGAVLRHFHGQRANSLASEVDRLVLEVNSDTLDRLQQVLQYAADCDLSDGAAACDFAEALATEINLRDLDFGTRQRDLRRRIDCFGTLGG